MAKLEEEGLKDVLYYGNCMQIFFADDTATATHPCSATGNDRRHEERLLRPIRIQGKVSKLISSISIKQRAFVEDVIYSNKTARFNVHLTGEGGTGNSYAANVLIHKLLYHYQGQAKIAVLCPTKQAAGQLNGKTIHSFFGLTHDAREDFNMNRDFIGDLCDRYIEKRYDVEWKRKVLNPVLSVEVMIIDECSLLSADGLRNIDYMLQLLRKEKKPFGGVRMILIGEANSTGKPTFFLYGVTDKNVFQLF